MCLNLAKVNLALEVINYNLIGFIVLKLEKNLDYIRF